MLGLVTAILSPALFAAVNYLDKFMLQRYEVRPVVIACYSGAISLCTALLLWLIIGVHLFPAPVTASIICSGFLTGLYVLPYFKALTLEDTATVVPLFQLVPVFVLGGGYVFLGEQLSLRQYVGCLVTVAASLLIAMERIDGRIFRPRPAFWYMLLSSLCAALALLTFKYGVTARSFWQVLPYESLGIALFAACLLLTPGTAAHIRRESARLPRRMFLIMGLDEALYIVSRYLGYFALSLLAAGVVSTLAGLQPLFVLVFGVLLSLWLPHVLTDAFDRATWRLKAVSTGLIVVGTALIAW